MKEIESIDDILSGLKRMDSEPGSDLKKFTIVLKNQQDKQNFIDDMRSQTSLVSNIPSRLCKALNEIENSRRVLEYNLTKEEAENIRKDSRVECVEQYIEKKIINLGFRDETILPKPFDYVETPLDSKLKIQSFDQSAVISGLPDGSDVDVVVVDGFMAPANPEFASNPDGTGGSRVNQIDWYDVISYTNPSYPSYPYSSFITGNSNSDLNNNHGSHVAGTISGNTQGWAKKSNIYNINPYYSFMPSAGKDLYLYAIKTWHENKQVNNLYGNKNPTISNHSYGYIWPYNIDIRNVLSIKYRGATLIAPRNYNGARLSAVLNGSGGISVINVINNGTNYTNEPQISFYGGGQATATAELASGSVYEIIITDGGSGYSSSNPPTVTFSSPPAGGTRATATIVSRRLIDDSSGNPYVYVNDNPMYQIGSPGVGQIFGIEITEAGSGYINPPTVTFSNPGPGGRVAQATVGLGSNFIKKINITNGGTGYSNNDSIPDVILSGVNYTESARIDKFLVIHNGERRYTDSNGSLLNGIYQPGMRRYQNFFGGPLYIRYSAGGNYSSSPTVSFYGGNSFPTFGPNAGTIVGTKPHVRAVMGTGSNAGKIMSIDVIKSGEGYTSPPNIVITNGGGFTEQQLSSYGVVIYYSDYLEDLNRPIMSEMPMRDSGVDSDIQDLIDSGVVVVVAAGNNYYKIDLTSGQDYDNYIQVIDTYHRRAEPSILPAELESTIDFYYHRGSSPGSCPGVICVGASAAASTEYKTDFSSTGPRVDVYAPGQHINSSTYNDGLNDPRDSNYRLAKWSGTSMASPQVAGMIACYAQNNRTINQQDARDFIINNAKPTVQNGTNYKSLQGGTNKYAYFPGISYR